MMYVVSCVMYICMIYDGGIMLKTYNEIKERYPKSVIMIKSGIFFECLNDDAKILNKVFGYKIKQLHKYIRVGFPISCLNKITTELTKKEINYITVIEGEIKIEKFKHNNYNDYTIIKVDCDNNDDNNDDLKLTYELALKKIKLINSDLMSNINNPKIIDILNEIERVICKINL